MYPHKLIWEFNHYGLKVHRMDAKAFPWIKRPRGLNHGLKGKGLKVHSFNYHVLRTLKNNLDNKKTDS